MTSSATEAMIGIVRMPTPIPAAAPNVQPPRREHFGQKIGGHLRAARAQRPQRPEEVQAGTIPGAINIPIDELRDRLDEVPKDKELLV